MKIAIYMICFGALISTAVPVSATELKGLQAVPEGHAWDVGVTQQFLRILSEESIGEINVTMDGPDVVPTFEQFEPTQAGVYDLLVTHPSYHAGINSLGMGIDAIKPDVQKRRDSGIIDFIDAHYQSLGMKLVAAPPMGSVGIQFFIKDSIDGSPPFANRRIRGTAPMMNLIEQMGGAGVLMQPGEVYSGLQTGLIDGVAWPRTGVVDFRWYEVADYIVNPPFGQVGLMIFMNLDVWNGLTPEQQSAVSRAGERIETASIDYFDKAAADEQAKLVELGMKFTELPQVDAEELNVMVAESMWSTAMEGEPDESAKLREMAKNTGLTY